MGDMTKANDRMLRGFVTLSSYETDVTLSSYETKTVINESSRTVLESALRCDCSARRRLNF